MRKGDDDEDTFDAAVDLSTLDLLVNATPDDLAAVFSDSGKQGLMQLKIEHEHNLVNQVHQQSLDYAKDRSAEMVGKKWVDGKLVDNPDAQWVITDSTRDELRGLVADVQSGDLKLTDLPQAIRDATAFSPERASMIARTEIMAANGPDDEACEICLGNADDGDIEVDAEFSSGDDAPPAHPNCECVIIPVVSDDAGDSEDDSEA